MKSGWTLERRQRQAEMIQRWQPWKQSTGARTAEGRNVSKLNALKHGFYSAESKIGLKELRSYLREAVIFLI
jgi:hypothetical protein